MGAFASYNWTSGTDSRRTATSPAVKQAAWWTVHWAASDKGWWTTKKMKRLHPFSPQALHPLLRYYGVSISVNDNVYIFVRPGLMPCVVFLLFAIPLHVARRAWQRLRRFLSNWRQAFLIHDLVLSPTTPGHAWATCLMPCVCYQLYLSCYTLP